ncbi:glycosyltransferase family 1 protein [Winogradskyella maritima]|uniref:Glycosyltransferase family 4 protein n=1 Tax=Winogradskyella maritima TaxID=1517766 RepID=A0ABV8ADL6_9FLAO|nr:glycosyltransferase family 1 protein [Winogradskyella maritima]
MAKKKILIDAHVFDDKHQGTRTYLKGLYNALLPIAKDWHFYFVARNVDILQREIIKNENVTFLPLKYKSKYLRLGFEIPYLIWKHKIDYAHFQYIRPPYKNCKFIVTLHDILFEEEKLKMFFPERYRFMNHNLFKWSAKTADILLTVSEYSKKQIVKHYDIHPDKIEITPNAPKTYIINSETQLKVPNKYILYVSRIEPRKNHLNLIKAFIASKLYEQGYKLVFIGKRDLFCEELETYLENNKDLNENHLIWLESVSNDTLAAYYSNCELFVFPSFAEGFGIPPLEAMSYGAKMICSDRTAMADFHFPEKISFNPDDVEEIQEKMMLQLEHITQPDIHLYKNLLRKYNWKNIASNYFNTLHRYSEG